MNDNLATVVVGVSTLVSFVCFVLIVIQMFQRGATGLAIACIALSLCCGLGGLVAFVYGWTRARDWNITNLMTVWTVAFAIDVLAGSLNPAPFRQVQQMIRFPAGPERSGFCLNQTSAGCRTALTRRDRSKPARRLEGLCRG